MPSAFQRRPRTLPTAASTAAADAGVSIGEVSSSGVAGSSSSNSPQAASSSAASSSASLLPSPPPAAAAAASLRPSTHATLRPSPFPQQQPLPLFSLGLNAINDVLTGLGLPSGSLALFLPVLPPDYNSTLAAARGEEEEQRRTAEAGAAYADLVVRYGAAQGLAAGQRVMVVGEEAEEWTRGLMGWTGAGAEEPKKAGASDVAIPEAATSTPAAANGKLRSGAEDEEDEGSSPSSSGKDSQLKVAFRYEKLKRLEEMENKALGIGSSSSASSSGQDNLPYVHPFDLSMKMPASVMREARQEGRLVVHSLIDEDEDAGNTYEHVWSLVKTQVATWRAQEEEQRQQWSSQAPQAQAQGVPALPPSPTPVRILLPSLGSPAWSVKCSQSHAVESYRLLLRIKKLLRSSSWIGNVARTGIPAPSASPSIEVPCIAFCSPSASLLSSDHTAATATRLATLADSALAFSSYGADARLRSVFQPPTSEGSSASGPGTGKSASFTGALQILKTPALGSLAPSSIRASQLRGLSSASGEGGGGGSGGENALGFKVRRKGFKVEVLGRDLVADWGAGGDDEDKKKKRKPPPAAPAAAPAKPSTSVVASAGAAPAKAKEAVTAASVPASTGPANAAATSTAPQAAPLKGLAALRARGLRAAAASGTAAPVAVGEEKAPSAASAHSHPRVHAHSSSPAADAEAQERQAKRELKEEQLRLAAGQDW